MSDFFISYNQTDQNWAEWIAWQLEDAGYHTKIQAWDFKAGENFILAMQKAATESQRTIVVLSPNFMQAEYTQPEWAAAFAQDPTGQRKQLIPVRIQYCELKGLQKALIYIDLVGLPEKEAKTRLLTQIKSKRTKPSRSPHFPGNKSPIEHVMRVEPEFPGLRHSAMKGLRPFTVDDAQVFLRLQRQTTLEECMRAIIDTEFRLGILFGESGCGKTSFLQAGLIPFLNQQANKYYPIFVKFTNINPLISLRQALDNQIELIPKKIDVTNFLKTLSQITLNSKQTLVLIFDQFEQFFVHFQREEQRKPLIELLSDWYKNGQTLPVKVLFSFRDDFYARHVELQQALDYTLGPQDNFSLKKFNPQQATEIFKVIAETEHLAYDKKFIAEMTARDLAHTDDGLISPVDLQILAWMIYSQTEFGKVVFGRKLYHQMGGIEGLLENYLLRAMQAVSPENRRQTVFKILLTLIDNNVRSGALTLAEIQKKLARDTKTDHVEAAVNWLAQSKVRLITPVKHNGSHGYELAHERLIPPILKLTQKFSSKTEQVNRLLEKRTNEWLGNDQASRYLLHWHELYLILKQKKYLIWGDLENAKKKLIKSSRQQLKKKLNFVGILFVLILIFWHTWPIFNTRVIEPKLREQRIKALNKQFVSVKGDTFEMGDIWGVGDIDEKPVHSVILSDFEISKYEITNQQYCDFLNSLDKSVFNSVTNWIIQNKTQLSIQDSQFVVVGGGKNHPVSGLTWHGADTLAKWLGGRLPTEAEWEFAARGGNKSRGLRYSGSEKLDDIAWYARNAGNQSHPVGMKLPNELDLYDMTGNVWEWCQDSYDSLFYNYRQVKNPCKLIGGRQKVLRGGGWSDSDSSLRVSNRSKHYMDLSYLTIGCRCVR